MTKIRAGCSKLGHITLYTRDALELLKGIFLKNRNFTINHSVCRDISKLVCCSFFWLLKISLIDIQKAIMVHFFGQKNLVIVSDVSTKYFLQI